MKRRLQSAFTLIELLVVIGIIAVLAAVLLPAVTGIFKQGEKVQAQADARRVVAGWKSYYAQYGRWPRGANEDLSTGHVMSAGFVEILMTRTQKYGAATSPDNPLALKFLEVGPDTLDAATGSMVDPWGSPYCVLFDTNFDGKVVFTAGTLSTTVYDTVVVWSKGADKKAGSTAEFRDNVVSWQ